MAWVDLNFLASFCWLHGQRAVICKTGTMLRNILVKGGLQAVYHSGAARLLAPHWGGNGVIFCLHHVTPGGGRQSGFAPNSNLEITPDFLDSIITLVKGRGYELLSATEAVERLKSVSAQRKRFALFTLDDGYKDNLQYALPVFRRHNCAFTVYAAPRIAEGTCELWWRGLEAVIAKADRLDLSLGDFLFRAETRNEPSKWAAWHALAPRVQTMPEYGQRDWIRRAADKHDVDLNALCRNAAMTWDELRLMAKEPLATIGAHTLNHYNLGKLPEADARREIIESGKQIESELGRKVEHFAYPYGNKDAAGPREFRLAREAGYSSAVVTRLGTVSAGHVNHLHALPRIMVSGRFQDASFIEALISGVPGRLANGFKALNVA
jgi:peptidoglycan/xylan/chitin deacetylase (PgdA/CDA1 family)